MNRSVYIIVFIVMMAGKVFAAGETNAVVSSGFSIGNLGSGTNFTVITSTRLNFDYKRSIAEFSGNVTVKDPRVRIEADQLNVIFDNESNVKSVTAVGNVRISQGDKVGVCKKAVYLSGGDKIIMMGDAKLSRPSESLYADEITFAMGGSAESGDIDSVTAVGNVRLQSKGGFSGKTGKETGSESGAIKR